MRSKTTQGRSRETEAKLIAAALRLLRQDGLEGFTVPALAAEAGLAVGTLYRRFRDKGALLQHVFEAMAANTETCLEADLKTATDMALPDFIEKMVSQLMAGYRADAQILAALQQFVRTHPDPEFRSRILMASAAGRRNLATELASLVTQGGGEDGESKARFAVFSCAAILQAYLAASLNGHSSADGIEDGQLERQLKAMLTAYLA